MSSSSCIPADQALRVVSQVSPHDVPSWREGNLKSQVSTECQGDPIVERLLKSIKKLPHPRLCLTGSAMMQLTL